MFVLANMYAVCSNLVYQASTQLTYEAKNNSDNQMETQRETHRDTWMIDNKVEGFVPYQFLIGDGL